MLLTPELLNRLTPLEIKARQIVEGFISGLHKSPFFGFSVEFAEHRAYHPGDDLRHMDWKVYGKTERFFVKQYEEETNLRCYLMLDISSSMHYRYYAQWSKLRYAVHLGAALSYMLHRQRDGCGLVSFDTEIGEILPAKSTYPHLRHLYRRLEDILENDEETAGGPRKTASAQAIHQLAERIQRRSMVIILTDLFENVQKHEELISALKHLRHKKHEVILFHLLEKRSERELDFPDDRFVFRDLETGGELDVIPSQIRNDYREKMKEFTLDFRIACSQAQIAYEEVDTGDPFDFALLAFLNKRRRLL